MKAWREKPGYGLASPAIWTVVFGLIAIVAGIFLFVVGTDERPAPYLGIMVGIGVLYLAIGLGSWQEKRLAAQAGFWLFAVAAVMRLVAILSQFQWQRLWMLVVFAWLAWEFRQAVLAMKEVEALLGASDDEDGEEGEKPLISFVLLLKSPRYLEEAILGQIVEEAWGGDYTSGDEEAQAGFVVGDSPTFVIKGPHGIFMVNNFPDPYFEDVEEVAEDVGELRLRRAIVEHEGWLSVDLMVPEDDSLPREEYYPLIIRLIYELVDDDVLAVLRPETGQINVWDDEVLSTLLKPDGIEQFNRIDPYVPVVPVADDDPAMLAAVEEARTRWPEFVEAHRERDSDDSFSVKAPITVGEDTEFIWIEVTGLEPEFIHGKLGNEPVSLEGLSLGSVVEVPVAEINDWFFAVGDQEPVGLFTVKVVQEAQDRFREEREDNEDDRGSGES